MVGKGIGKVKSVVKYLSKYENVQLLVVCGKNEKLKKQIDKMCKPNIYTFGYINFVDELMTVADYLFGKTGGLSATEALAKELSIISYKNIPCPEYNNLMFLESNGYAKSVKNPKEVLKAIFNEGENEKDKTFYLENSAQKIYEAILKSI